MYRSTMLLALRVRLMVVSETTLYFVCTHQTFDKWGVTENGDQLVRYNDSVLANTNLLLTQIRFFKRENPRLTDQDIR